LILFVHGLGGDGPGTWGDFPRHIAADARLAEYDVGFFEYPTAVLKFKPWKRYPPIQTLGDALRTVIDNRYSTHRPIVVVAHSLGGLVARQYLIDGMMDDAHMSVSKLLLYGVPNTGAGLAKVATHISWHHSQLRQLCKDSDLIDLLNRAWQRLKVADRVDVRYVLGSDDRVVDEAAARGFPGNPKVDVILGRGHRSLVKPTSSDDLTFQILQNFVVEPVVSASPGAVAAEGKGPFRVIAFDLDGTLIRGLKFSWTLVWEHLGYSPDISRAGMLRYLHGQTSYAEWCSWAVRMFRAKGLKREHFKDIVKGLTLTRNLREGLKTLKADGFTLALISGGVDAVLYEMIPDANALFDHVFINRLKFEANGLVSCVDATPYDFDGKADALRQICAERGYSVAQAVFVGEGFNDGHVCAIAGLSIAYPPRAYETEAASHVLIEEDDLLKVVERVIGA
jgi:HAD superfamily phosphoserine phosphatase-like hydrolase